MGWFMGFVKFAVLPAVLVFSLASAAAAEDASTTNAGAPTLNTAAPSQDDPNAVICHKGEPPIGSRIPGPSVCRTRAEWDRIRQDARDETMRTQTTSGAGCTSMCGQ